MSARSAGEIKQDQKSGVSAGKHALGAPSEQREKLREMELLKKSLMEHDLQSPVPCFAEGSSVRRA